MKKILFAVAALVISAGVFAQKKSDDVAKFKTETIDLGKLKQNNPQPAVFEVTNIGKEDLLIEQANPTCGCTIGEYTKTPIKPGEIGYIKATYNAKNLGMFEKHLTVKFGGCDDMKSITIKGEVLADESAVAPAATPAAAPVATPVAETLVSEKAATPAKTSATAPAKKTAPKTTTLKKP